MILVTGGGGQVATELAALGGERVARVGRPEFDFDRPESLAATFDRVRPSAVVNAAAWTAVDLAETEEAAAFRANRDGPAALARLCAEAGLPLVHLSTDYVFDGRKPTPYQETDPTGPMGVYGRSKLAGEAAVLAAGGRATVLRTAWVYNATGKNFVRTMLGAALKTDTLRVVADQTGSPTNAADLAAAILAVLARMADWRPEYAGVFHAAGSGSVTWHGFAEAIFDEAAKHGRRRPTVQPIATADWPTPAARPLNSCLDCTKLREVFGAALPNWRPSLARTVATMLA